MAKRRGAQGAAGGLCAPLCCGAGGWHGLVSVRPSVHPSTHVQASRCARVIYQRGRGKESAPIISGVRLGS